MNRDPRESHNSSTVVLHAVWISLETQAGRHFNVVESPMALCILGSHPCQECSREFANVESS